MCSRLTEVITESMGVMILVESSRPPKPRDFAKPRVGKKPFLKMILFSLCKRKRILAHFQNDDVHIRFGKMAKSKHSCQLKKGRRDATFLQEGKAVTTVVKYEKENQVYTK